MRLICLLFLSAMTNAGHSTDVSRVRFGPEFTFSAGEDESLQNYKLQAKLHLIDNQPEGSKFAKSLVNSEALVSPNGWWFEPRRDNGVIEVKMSPLTVDEWKNFARDIQDAVFVTAYNQRYFPALYLGGGHINLDLSELIKDPLLLRNFIVDYWNHNELALGIFNYDSHNSISLSLLNKSNQDRIYQFIRNFDFLLGKSRKPTETQILQLLKDISGETYSSSSFVDVSWGTNTHWGMSARGKRTDLFFGHAANQMRLEIRAVRPQSDVYTWIHQISLIQSRLQYLSKKRTPIPIKQMVALQEVTTPEQIERAKLTPPIDPQEALKSFYIYVTQAKQQWKHHRKYIWPQWVTGGELKKFAILPVGT